MADIPIGQSIINNFRNKFLPAIGAMTGDSSFFGLSSNWGFCPDINLSSCSIYSSTPQYQLQMPTFGCFDSFYSSISPTSSGMFPQYQLQTPTSGPYDFSFASTNLYSPIIGKATPSVSAGTASTLGTDTGSGEILPDGTVFEVAGIDYSIFGNYANQIKRLRPLMQQKMELMFKYAKNKGWKITFNSMFRSYAEQEHLYNEYLAGRGNLAAKPGTSRHEFGCAVDLKVNGSSKNWQTAELGRYAQTIGMRWGGNTINEPWHFDLDPAKTPKARRASASSATA